MTAAKSKKPAAARPDLRAVGDRPAPGGLSNDAAQEAAPQAAPAGAKRAGAKQAGARQAGARQGAAPETGGAAGAVAGEAAGGVGTAAPGNGRNRAGRGAGRGRKAAVQPGAVPPSASRLKPRHYGVLASFALCVVLPFLVVTTLLFTRTTDQYHSEIAFSIRSEEAVSSATGLLGALTQIGSGTASDADILFEFIRSPEIVAQIDADLDLRAIYAKAGGDPFFGIGEDISNEALLAHWSRMVKVEHNSSVGTINVRANAFTPEDALAISSAVLAESDRLVNRLSLQARDDAVRFAQEELAEAEENLRIMRQRLGDFRRTHNIVDPSADVASQSGLLGALQEQLAQALVDRDVLLSYASEGDQRVLQANRRIEAITARLEEERSSLNLTGLPGSLPDVVGTYEELLVDLEFANTAYTQALAGLTAARAEARRQSRYLAAHVEPTLATTSLYPRRFMLAGLTGFFLLAGWGVLMLFYYNVRDNR